MTCPQCGRCDPAFVGDHVYGHEQKVMICRRWLASAPAAVDAAKGRWHSDERPTPEDVITAYSDTRYARNSRPWWHLWHKLCSEVMMSHRSPEATRQVVTAS